MKDSLYLLVGIACLSCSGIEEGLQNSRPNIILVMTDDQGSNLSWIRRYGNHVKN